MSRSDLFWKKVSGGDVTTCWRWQAARDPDGYGRFWDGKRMALAHRWAYEELQGPTPAPLVLDHLCRTPACVNPWHLEPVTHQINIQRGIFPNSLKTHCPQGHPYSEENTRLSKQHRRFCRTCHRIRSANNREQRTKEQRSA